MNRRNEMNEKLQDISQVTTHQSTEDENDSSEKKESVKDNNQSSPTKKAASPKEDIPKADEKSHWVSKQEEKPVNFRLTNKENESQEARKTFPAIQNKIKRSLETVSEPNLAAKRQMASSPTSTKKLRGLPDPGCSERFSWERTSQQTSKKCATSATETLLSAENRGESTEWSLVKAKEKSKFFQETNEEKEASEMIPSSQKENKRRIGCEHETNLELEKQRNIDSASNKNDEENLRMLADCACNERTSVECTSPIPSTSSGAIGNNNFSPNQGPSSNYNKLNFRCEYCGKCFRDNFGLSRHVRTHTGENPFSCEICFKKFNTREDVVKHNRCHTGETPFKCPICGRAFRHRSNMTRHKKTHGKKKILCEICFKMFNTREDLLKHNRCHTGETPFNCPICGRAFRHKSNMTRHKKTHGKKKD